MYMFVIFPVHPPNNTKHGDWFTWTWGLWGLNRIWSTLKAGIWHGLKLKVLFPLDLAWFWGNFVWCLTFFIGKSNLTYLQYFTISYIHKVSDVHFLITNPLGLGWLIYFWVRKVADCPEKPKERNEVEVDIPQTALKKQHVHKPD